MMLKQKYNREDFLEFQKQFLPDFKRDIRPVSKNGLEVTQDVFLLGQSDQLDLQIFEFTHTSSTNARVSLATDGFKVMKSHGVYQALMVYHSLESDDWRFSLMTATPEITEKGKIRPAFSNPRRYSFFLGPDAKTHTPGQYLIDKGKVESLEDLKNRFSIEVVNKDFYLFIADLFSKLAGGKHEHGRKKEDYKSGLLKLPSSTDETARKEFTVRLIGRLVFCWFLKKKKSEKNVPLLPEQLLSSAAVRENKNYYHTILEPLFFEVLNTPNAERSKSYREGLWQLTPFLNGGLFSPHDGPHGDFYELGDLGTSKHINTLKVPDQWLEELFEAFERYNFTIDENTSVDVELSIEPEMLGRIFENLLAEINPETGETARKATGSYYTPRPIVDYMVDESLKQYLINHAQLSDVEAAAMLSYELEATSVSESKRVAIIDALDSIKIIDPACGSGAFPMGILQKMLLVLQKVDPDSQNWLDKKLSSIGDATLRKDLKAKLKADNFNYVHKLGIIRDAIYGVDIQPIAVEISKLRFFLSLIVDERVNDSKENRGIEPLPNLEFKFVCANSLIGLPKGDSQQTLFESNEDIKLLKDLRDEYLRSYGNGKKKIQKKFLEVQSRMTKHAMSWALFGGAKSKTMELSQWDPFAEGPCSWFDSDWMFGIKDDFDIVIANPPYTLKLETDYKQLLKSLYPLLHFKINLFACFIEKSLAILASKGTLAYIIPNLLFANDSLSKLRLHMIDNTAILQLMNLGDGVFEEVTMPTMVILLKKIKAANNSALVFPLINDMSDLSDKLCIQQASFRENYNYVFETSRPEAACILRKIEKRATPLGDWLAINQGVITGDDEKYLSSMKKNDEWKPCARGRDVTKYLTTAPDLYVHYDRRKLACPRTEDLFDCKEKLLLRRTADHPVASYDAQKLYNLHTLYSCRPKKEASLKYLLGLLNSRLYKFIYQQKMGAETGRTFAEIKILYIRQLPVVLADQKEAYSVEQKVNEIIAAKKSSDFKTNAKKKEAVSRLEEQIDLFVYSLFGLTKDEIKIVEESTKPS